MEQVILLLVVSGLILAIRGLLNRTRRKEEPEEAVAPVYDMPLSLDVGVHYYENEDELDVSFGRSGTVVSMPVLDDNGVAMDDWLMTCSSDLEGVNGIIIKNASKYTTFLARRERFSGIGFRISKKEIGESLSDHITEFSDLLGELARRAKQDDTEAYLRQVYAIASFAVDVLSRGAENNEEIIKSIAEQYQLELFDKSAFQDWIKHETDEIQPAVNKVIS